MHLDTMNATIFILFTRAVISHEIWMIMSDWNSAKCQSISSNFDL